jgi:hypothetical protein
MLDPAYSDIEDKLAYSPLYNIPGALILIWAGLLTHRHAYIYLRHHLHIQELHFYLISHQTPSQ